MKKIILFFICIVYFNSLYAQEKYLECEIPGGKLVEERLCTGGTCNTIIKLIYNDSIVVLHQTNQQKEDNPINKGIMANPLSVDPENPIYQGVSKRGFVLSDTSFVCVWTMLEPAAIRSYWFAKFSLRNNQWQPTVFRRILDYMEGANSTGYRVYFLSDHLVYLTSQKYFGDNNINKFDSFFILLNNDKNIIKFVIDTQNESVRDTWIKIPTKD